jgi:hypothetical protein
MTHCHVGSDAMNLIKWLIIIGAVVYVVVLIAVALSPLWMPGATLTGAIFADLFILSPLLTALFSVGFWNWLLGDD